MGRHRPGLHPIVAERAQDEGAVPRQSLAALVPQLLRLTPLGVVFLGSHSFGDRRKAEPMVRDVQPQQLARISLRSHGEH
jgi:hypothetical protein